MNVRPASFRDLGRIEQLYTQALAEGDPYANPLHPERPVPQASALIRLWYLVSKTLSSLMPLSEGGDTLYVAEDSVVGVVGFVQAQPAPGKTRAWQIVNLCTVTTALREAAAEHLLTGLCQRGQDAGVRRFYVRLPLDHPLLTAFVAQGFGQYATEQILFSDCDRIEGVRTAGVLRPARRDDMDDVYLLYLRVTPATVAAVEAPNRKAWESTFGGGAVARLGRDEASHFIAERSGVHGWAAIRTASAARPTGMWLLYDAHDGPSREAFLDAVFAELPGGPVSCVLRHYDSELIRSLQQRGFAIYGTQVLLAKDLAVRVRQRALLRGKRKKPILVPAGLARTVENLGRREPLR